MSKHWRAQVHSVSDDSHDKQKEFLEPAYRMIDRVEESYTDPLTGKDIGQVFITVGNNPYIRGLT